MKLDGAFHRPDPDKESSLPLASAYRDWVKSRHIDVSNIRCRSCGMLVYEMKAGGALADDERLDARFTEPTIRALGRVLGDLANLGYDAVWRGLEASSVGAPHRRLRLFVTAWPHDPGTARMPANARLKRLASLPPIRPHGRAWAVWDEARDVWMLPDMDLFGEGSVFMDSWPKNGIMAAGRVYHVPASWLGEAGAPSGMPATPTASDPDHEGPNQRYGAGNPSLAGCIADTDLLYTPKATDGVFDSPMCSGRPVSRSTYLSTQTLLLDAPGRMSVEDEERRDRHQSEKRTRMLPTPGSQMSEHGGSVDPDVRRANKHMVNLTDEIDKGHEISLMATPSALYDSTKACNNGIARREKGRQLGLSDQMLMLGEDDRTDR
ncbi:hypothetical protein [Bifidobacterium sp. SO1]|uniref:hypothetical protein n=1 Tax=Bifidobacterium sp. SO1 TaxID=2809029 RepID=UPI001F0A5CD2|nr:hypothetical protein [Bifidobacterium sp. SO1]